MAQKTELGTDPEGRFKRVIGYRQTNDKIVKQLFRLGRNKEAALTANTKLETLWQSIVDHWKEDKREGRTTTVCPLWDSLSLVVAQAVAKGQTVAELPQPMPDMAPAAIAVYLSSIQPWFPMIGLTVAGYDPTEAASQLDRLNAGLDQARATNNRAMTAAPTVSVSGTLYQALAAYCDHLRLTLPNPKTQRSAIVAVGTLRQHIDNHGLDKLTADVIEKTLVYFSNRPNGKNGEPLAQPTVRALNTRYRNFLQWLNRSDRFAWQMPRAFVFPRQRIRKLESDRIKKRRYFTVAEIAILWTAAKPFERALILLGLNCGFSKAEISTLQKGEIVQGKNNKYIKRHRRKSEVYGEWILWPETLAGLDFLSERQTSATGNTVVLNSHGGTFATPTRGGNENQAIKNHWDRLIKTIKATHPDFPPLPFKCLRKTGANMIRKLGGDVVASYYLSHGERSDGGDSLLSVYTDRSFKKMHRTILKLGKALRKRGVFASVDQPWQAERRGKNAAPPKTVAAIIALRKEGKSFREIGLAVGMHEMSAGKIYRATTKPKAKAK